MSVPEPSDAVYPRSAIQRATVLLVQPDAQRALSAASELAQRGARVLAARTVDAADRHTQGRIDAAIVDESVGRDAAIQIVRSLRTRRMACFTSLLTGRLRRSSVRRLLLSGVWGVLHHPLRPGELISAVQELVVATRCLREDDKLSTADSISGGELTSAVHSWTERHGLTMREAGVLELLARGYGYRDVAETLGISPRTVKMHATNLRRKSGFRDRRGLIRSVWEEAA